MKKKINICLEDRESFFEMRSLIAQIRLEKTEKQVKIFRALGWFSIIVLFILLAFLETNKDNIIFVFFPVILISLFSGFVYAYSFLFSIIPVKRVRRDFVENFELLISTSRCFFIKIRVNDYEKELIKKIKQKMGKIDKEISKRVLSNSNLKKGIDLLEGEETGDPPISMPGKIFVNNVVISQLNIEKEKYEELLSQILQ